MFVFRTAIPRVLQRDGAIYIYNDFISPYKHLLSMSSKCMLYISRLKVIVTEVYKIVNGNVPEYLKDIFIEIQSVYETRRAIQLKQRKYNTITYGFNSMKYQGAKIWNSVPNAFKEATTLNSLKQLLSTWEGPSCNNCNSCTICDLMNV